MTDINRFLVIAGQPGAGKDEAGKHLAESFNLWHVTARDVIGNEARVRGHEGKLTREILGKVKDEMDREHNAPVVSFALEQYKSKTGPHPGGLVISGLRRIGEVQYAKDEGAEIWFISADEAIRHKRIVERDRIGDMTLAEHIEREKIEAEGLTEEGRNGIWLNGVEAMADVRITNNGSLQEFQEELERIWAQK